MHPDKTGVLTPEDELMAERPKEQVMGKVPMKDPTNWHIPSATISFEASILLVGAEKTRHFQDLNQIPSIISRVRISYGYRI